MRLGCGLLPAAPSAAACHSLHPSNQPQFNHPKLTAPSYRTPQPNTHNTHNTHTNGPPGGHPTPLVASALRGYLQQEWARQRAEGLRGAGAPSTVPAAWAAARPNAGPIAVDAAVLPAFRPPGVPRQDNHCDCGVFLLAFLEHFATLAPRFGSGGGGGEGDGGDAAAAVAAAGPHLGGGAAAAAAEWKPGLPRPELFCARNARLLRAAVRARVHRLMAEQAARRGPRGAAAEAGAARLLALADAHDARPAPARRYLPPAARLRAAEDAAAAAALTGWEGGSVGVVEQQQQQQQQASPQRSSPQRRRKREGADSGGSGLCASGGDSLRGADGAAGPRDLSASPPRAKRAAVGRSPQRAAASAPAIDGGGDGSGDGHAPAVPQDELVRRLQQRQRQQQRGMLVRVADLQGDSSSGIDSGDDSGSGDDSASIDLTETAVAAAAPPVAAEARGGALRKEPGGRQRGRREQQ